MAQPAVFWRKVLLVLKVILRYVRLKFFVLWTRNKATRKAWRWPPPENLKWKKYIRQSKNDDGSPLEPL